MPSGSKPGERRGGRKKGVPNKVTGQNRERLTQLAQSYEVEAINILMAIARDEAITPAARATCCNSILDRARGKPAQAITGADGGPIIHKIERVIVDIANTDG